jgi:hypothetical protein
LIESNTHKEEIDFENMIFLEKKKNFEDKLNYYRNILNSLNNSSSRILPNQLTNEINFNSDENSNPESLLTKNNPEINTSIKATKSNLNKTHLRSHSHSSNFAKAKNQITILSNVEYDMNYNTNQDSLNSTNKLTTSNLKTLQLNHVLDNQLMRPVK